MIDTELLQLEADGRRFRNPTVCEPNKPGCAFVPADAKTLVLHDWGILEVFREHGCLSALPRFLRAGERREYRFDPACVNVGILIAGGIAAGLNMVVDAIVKRHFALATQLSGTGPNRLRIYGYDGGYEGLLEHRKSLLAPTSRAAESAGYPPGPRTRETDRMATAGGSMLIRAGRGEEVSGDAALALAKQYADAIRSQQLDILYVIGGNGTLSWAARVSEALLQKTDRPVAIVGAPKTMDNDVFFTDTTLGFQTAVDAATAFALAVHLDAEAQDRIGLLEVFGAKSGWVALHACYDSGEGDVVFIPELMPDVRQEFECALTKEFDYIESRLTKNGHAVVVVAEGALPEYKWRDVGAKDTAFANLLSKFRAHFMNGRRPGDHKAPGGISDVRSRYLVRSTPPNTYDIELCKVTGKLMVDTGLAGFTGCCVNRWHNEYVLVPFHTAASRRKVVPLWDFFLQTYLDRRRIQVPTDRQSR